MGQKAALTWKESNSFKQYCFSVSLAVNYFPYKYNTSYWNLSMHLHPRPRPLNPVLWAAGHSWRWNLRVSALWPSALTLGALYAADLSWVCLAMGALCFSAVHPVFWQISSGWQKTYMNSTFLRSNKGRISYWVLKCIFKAAWGVFKWKVEEKESGTARRPLTIGGALWHYDGLYKHHWSLAGLTDGCRRGSRRWLLPEGCSDIRGFAENNHWLRKHLHRGYAKHLHIDCCSLHTYFRNATHPPTLNKQDIPAINLYCGVKT